MTVPAQSEIAVTEQAYDEWNLYRIEEQPK